MDGPYFSRQGEDFFCFFPVLRSGVHSTPYRLLGSIGAGMVGYEPGATSW